MLARVSSRDSSLPAEHTQVIARINHGNLEPLQDHGDGHDHLLLSKKSANTSSGSVSERLPCIRGQLFPTPVHKSFRAEKVRILSPDSAVMVQPANAAHHALVSTDAVLSANDRVLERGDAEGVNRTLDSQGLTDAGLDVFKLRQMFGL